MYFFDTYAVIEMVRKNPRYERYVNVPITCSVLNYGELYLYFLRLFDKAVADTSIEKIDYIDKPLSNDIIRKAALFKRQNAAKRFSWADAVGYVTAQQHNLKFLTGDSQFKGLPNVEFVK